MEITRTALVPRPAMAMFRLVEDIERYPDFLSWCAAADLIEQSGDMQLARLEVSLAGLRQDFTTRNRLERGQRLSMSLVDGPFRQLSGEWRFLALGDSGCKITLDLAFDFSNSVLSAAFRRGFSNVADRLVADFVRRAEAVYTQGEENGKP
ncbi:type II toxin-antitoxin system RatA family toxin [Elongatibacter sediminis]|uniref:Type II toxin-antitoxin system RatA family toxin n=1 Tax=Elongatibacter sediminis TaxID=3119006 RepID=A0AAW9REQ6_9GAMM